MGWVMVGSRGWGFYVPFDRPVAKTLAASFTLPETETKTDRKWFV